MFFGLFSLCSCDSNHSDFPEAFITNIAIGQTQDFDLEEKNAFLIFRPSTFNASITIPSISNDSIPFTTPHFYAPFSKFTIQSLNTQLSILYWVLPDNFCNKNNSVIGTEEYISSALHFHDTPFPTCIFLANSDKNAELNQSFHSISGRIVYNGSSLSSAPILFSIEPSFDGIFTLSYNTHKSEPNLKGSCFYQTSYHFDGYKFIQDYNGSLEYLHDCKNQSIQNKWWIYFVVICSAIVIALLIGIVIVIKYNKGTCCKKRANYESVPEAPDEILFSTQNDSTLDQPPATKPVYVYTEPTENTDLLFYDKKST